MQRDHAIISPSNAANIIACPARVLMSQGSGGHMDGDITVREEGTAAHEVCEVFVITGLMMAVGELAENKVAVTEEMQKCARVWAALLAEWPVMPQIEVKLPVPSVPLCFGTTDAGAAAQTYGPQGYPWIGIADYKFGYSPVDVWPNPQLALYASAMAAASGIALDANTQVDLMIYQPRAWHREGVIRRKRVNGDDINRLVAEVAEAAYAALDLEPIAKPGRHCRTCSGRAKCGALRDVVMSNLRVTADGDTPLEFLERELSFLQQQKELLDAYVSGISLQIEHCIKSGQHSQIYEMRKQAGRLEWIPGKESQVRAMAQLMGKSVEAPGLITPTQAREIIGPAVDAFASRSHGAIKLVKRPPANTLFPPIK